MILLTSTNDKVQVITGSALNTDVHASYVDLSAGPTVTPDRKNTLITTAATTDVVLAPAASTQRNVKTLTVRNRDAAASQVVTVRHTDGTTTSELFKTTLLAGEQLIYSEGGWKVIDAAGGIKSSDRVGRFLRTTIIQNGTTTFTTGPDTIGIFVRMVGAGGGGGGCTSVASAAAAAGGGGAGGYAEKYFTVTPNTVYTVAVGAGGAGASGAAGNNGGNTTFAVGATTVTAPGGTGGPVATAAVSLTARAGGAGGAVATNGDVNSAGAPGEYGVVLIVATPIVASGNGGSGPFGGGGVGLVAVGNGNNGAGFGAGGGGSATGASAVRTGGNGTNGLIVVDEYA